MPRKRTKTKNKVIIRVSHPITVRANTDYFLPTKPCVHGHTTLYTLSNCYCLECDRLRELERKGKRHIAKKTFNGEEIDIKAISILKCVGAKVQARKLGLPFNLTPEYIESIWPEDNKCPFGILLVSNAKAPRQNSSSLDRIYPEKGYVQGNVQIVSQQYNALKSNMTPEQLAIILKVFNENKEKDDYDNKNIG